MSIITVPFSWLLMTLYGMFENYGVAIILFALVVNAILTPFMGKSKASMMRQQRLQPRLNELQRRHGANQQKYNEEVQKLYRGAPADNRPLYGFFSVPVGFLLKMEFGSVFWRTLTYLSPRKIWFFFVALISEFLPEAVATFCSSFGSKHLSWHTVSHRLLKSPAPVFLHLQASWRTLVPFLFSYR